MRCGLLSEWADKLISLSTTPMEILVLQWKVSTLRWKASANSDGIPKLLQWKFPPHTTTNNNR
jgi:hypothetical protein